MRASVCARVCVWCNKTVPDRLCFPCLYWTLNRIYIHIFFFFFDKRNYFHSVGIWVFLRCTPTTQRIIVSFGGIHYYYYYYHHHHYYSFVSAAATLTRADIDRCLCFSLFPRCPKYSHDRSMTCSTWFPSLFFFFFFFFKVNVLRCSSMFLSKTRMCIYVNCTCIGWSRGMLVTKKTFRVKGREEEEKRSWVRTTHATIQADSSSSYFLSSSSLTLHAANFLDACFSFSSSPPGASASCKSFLSLSLSVPFVRKPEEDNERDARFAKEKRNWETKINRLTSGLIARLTERAFLEHAFTRDATIQCVHVPLISSPSVYFD